MRVGALRRFHSFHRYTVNYQRHNVQDPCTVACDTLVAVPVERVRESSLLGRINGQVIVLLDLNPSDRVVALVGVDRGEPGSRVLVALGLVKVVGDSD